MMQLHSRLLSGFTGHLSYECLLAGYSSTVRCNDQRLQAPDMILTLLAGQVCVLVSLRCGR